METIRIDKYLSVALAMSRSDAKALLRQKVVKINGQLVLSPDVKVSDRDEVSVRGEKITYKKYIYLVMNKPKGVISASSDKRARTVLDLVSDEYRHYELFCVGRLDKDTTGLLLITNDGDFAHRIISPKSNTDKRYHVILDGNVTNDHVEIFSRGVVLADGTKCLPADLRVLDACEAEITVKEGKYHQVKRMFGTVGLGVNELKRLSIGGLELPADIKEGESRELTDEEFARLGI